MARSRSVFLYCMAAALHNPALSSLVPRCRLAMQISALSENPNLPSVSSFQRMMNDAQTPRGPSYLPSSRIRFLKSQAEHHRRRSRGNWKSDFDSERISCRETCRILESLRGILTFIFVALFQSFILHSCIVFRGRASSSVSEGEILNYIATGETDKDCSRSNVTEHLSAEVEASLPVGDVSFARRNRIFLSRAVSRRLPPEKRILEMVRKRRRSHQSCSEETQDDRGVVLDVTDVTLILFRRSLEKRS